MEIGFILLGLAIEFLISLIVFVLTRDECEHDWEFIQMHNVFDSDYDKYPIKRYDKYRCKNCLEYKKVYH